MQLSKFNAFHFFLFALLIVGSVFGLIVLSAFTITAKFPDATMRCHAALPDIKITDVHSVNGQIACKTLIPGDPTETIIWLDSDGIRIGED